LVGYYCAVPRDQQFPIEDSVARCEDSFSVQIAVLCANGWKADCALGCLPHEGRRIRDRVDFWEIAVAEVIKTGYHYSIPTPEFVTECGCATSKVRLIEYGSGVGFDCILKNGWEQIYDKTRCFNGHHSCKSGDDDILTFCPVGYIPTCKGCIPGVPGLYVEINGDVDDSGTVSKTIEDKLGWLVDVLAGYSRLTQRYIGWMPDPETALACACKEELNPVEYGMYIGYTCKIWDPKSVQMDQCGLVNNIVCQDHEGDNVLHMCPQGYVPSCDNGCTFPWEVKTEL